MVLTMHEACREEEVSFSRTLLKGIDRFKKAAAAAQNGHLDSKDAFELWDSYGFPIDLTQASHHCSASVSHIVHAA